MTVGEICERECIPKQFAYKILKKLEKAGYVHITRGVVGGCTLSVNLKNVSLLNLMEAIEAEKTVNSCLQPEHKCEWQKSHPTECTVHRHLVQLQQTLDAELRRHSIYQMISDD